MQGVALLENPMPVMTAAEVARQGYAALKAERPQIITGLVNRIIAMSTRLALRHSRVTAYAEPPAAGPAWAIPGGAVFKSSLVATKRTKAVS